MNVVQYYSVLKVRGRIVSLVALGTVTAVMGIALVLPKTYTATTSIMVDIKAADPVGGFILGSALPPEVLQGYMATQAEVIASERSASKVIQKLDLDKDEVLREKWANGPGEKVSFDSWLLEELRKKLEVKPARDSNVISVAFSDPSRKKAAEVANAFAQAYLETDIELKVEPARKAAAWFDERTKVVRTKLDKAQARLSEYQRQKGFVIATDEKFDVENARLNELGSQLTTVQGAAAESESKQRQAGALPEVVQSPVVQALRSELAKEEAKLRELSSQLGSNHPQLQKQEAEVRALRERVATEMAQVAGSIGATTRVNQQREAQIKAAYEAQKGKVLGMKAMRDEASLLLRDVENAKREYDLLIQRLSQSSLESQAIQTNVTVLNRATEPLTPSSPNLKLSLLLSILVGTWLGVAIAFLLEGLDRRIRDANDLEESLKLPVLGILERSAVIGRAVGASDLPRLPGNAGSTTN